jgi:Flp pilus assembly secretin CpaC
LFKSKSERAQQTELMVLITPRLVRPLDPDEVPPLPTRFKPIIKGGDGKDKKPSKDDKGGTGGEADVVDSLRGTGAVDAPPAPATDPKASNGKKRQTGGR